MGSCQSTATAATQAPPLPEAATFGTEKKQSVTTAATARESSSSNTVTSPSPPPSPRVHFPSTPTPLQAPHLVDEESIDAAAVKPPKLPTPIQKGYSSGASSISEETDEQKAKGHTRDTSDLLRLQSMKTSLKTDGTINTNVVRIETPFGKPIESVYDGVHDGEILGSGISGVVRLVTHRGTGCKYAVKILDIGLVKSDEVLEQLRDEVFIMCQLDHPNIVRIEEVYESTNEIYIVQELCLGGDLFDRLDMQPDFHYTEVQCARLVKQMLSSVRYLHSKGIIHRDIKLENWLFSTAEGSALKMIDFGLSKHFEFGEVHHEAVGTPYAVSPEVIKGSYTEKSDIWSIGTLTYLLLCGESPFGGCDGEPLMEVRDNILRGDLKFEPMETWAHVSESGKQFVTMLLNRDPAKRPSAKLAQRHAWIQVYASMDKEACSKLDPNVINSLVNFKELSDMRKLLSEVLSYTLLPDQIKDLRGQFEKIDKDGSGEISLADLRQVLIKSAEEGSLGALTEQEVEDIFNALRVGKSDPMIRWHEFIAAGLSQCKVDERNLRLAFDRLDAEGKGYITLEDLRAIMGADGCDRNESLSNVWSDGIRQCKTCCEGDHITYEDFRAIMKGQTPEPPGIPRPSPGIGQRLLSSRKRSIDMTEAPLTPVDESKLDASVDSAFVTPGRTYVRQKSHSMKEKRAEKWVNYDEESDSMSFMLVGRDSPDVHDLLRDDSKTTIEVNRAVYRAHREMRMAVLEASKRFEEERARRAHERKIALGIPNGSTLHRRASLVMKRGSMADMSREEKEEQAVLDDASQRGGRPSRRKRNRTMSDIQGMIGARSTLVDVSTASGN